MHDWEVLLRGDTQVLFNDGQLRELLAYGDWKVFLAGYMGIVIVLLMIVTKTPLKDKYNLKTILMATFGWPLIAPFFVWRALGSR
ncbi:hypothetical protein [Microvirga sp. 2TAF3]|uniref:hypothetical protein n=1 Tax=Microvirga sp. 2TAF3 TaxID=3233014 RepID=UPI003F97E1E5